MRGGVDIAQAALAAGHAVVATGRNAEHVSSALGTHADLLVVALDVTNVDSARNAVNAAVDRFGRIDLLVNNAGNFYAGFFEEIPQEDVRAQIETTLFGPLNVKRAVLPVMRGQRSGLIITITSTAGIVGQAFCTAYAASKFGIRTMLVEPGFFRTQLLSPESTQFAKPQIGDYAKRTQETIAACQAMNGKQGGDPAKLARALAHLAGDDHPPFRFIAGADAIATVEQKASDLLAQAKAHRELSSGLVIDARQP